MRSIQMNNLLINEEAACDEATVDDLEVEEDDG